MKIRNDTKYATIMNDLSKQANRLKEFLLEKAASCVHKPDGKLTHSYVTPTYAVKPGTDDAKNVPERSSVGHYLQMYDWDACFFSQMADQIGRPDLAYCIISNFLNLMDSSGYVPRTVSPGAIWDSGDLCKPFLSQAYLRQYEKHGIAAGPLDFIDQLNRYLKYFEHNRRHDSGLYHWRNVLESGVDNNLALLAPVQAAKDENSEVGSFPDGQLLAVDLNSYLAAEFASFSKLCSLVGNESLAKEYEQQSHRLVKLIEDKLWDEELSVYCNLNPTTSEPVRILSWTNLLPVCLGIAQKDRAKRVVENLILEKRYFFQPSGLASVATCELLCNQAVRGLYGRVMVSNWQGPVWVLPNALAVRGLIHYGYKKEAGDLARCILSTLCTDLEQTGALHENYNAFTGQGLWAPQFMSWNFLALELMELL